MTIQEISENALASTPVDDNATRAAIHMVTRNFVQLHGTEYAVLDDGGYILTSLFQFVLTGNVFMLGDFLENVMRNKFVEAVTSADNTRLSQIREIAVFVYNRVPQGARDVDAWTKAGGILGRKEAKPYLGFDDNDMEVWVDPNEGA